MNDTSRPERAKDGGGAPTESGSEGRSKPIAESVEEAASGKLGVEFWDRPRIFRDTAAAATDASLPYWLALVLSGAIATLGLAIDSSAVVIGAMLVAPLLAPVLGLAMALAVGDGRLAIQSGLVVVLSTFAVLATGALLTMALPFQTITLEISQRTRPTTLDLAIAVFSGLVGAVVTVSRGKQLSAVIPGVAIAVALIPPLAVAGFGVGAGWNGRLIHGALLLYGANLGGIVLSGMLVFFLVGMHRPEVISEAQRWHGEGTAAGVAAWVTRLRWVKSVGTMDSPWKRTTLVLGFVVAVGVPLSETLGQLARERRVRDAVEVAAEVFNVPGRSSIVSRQVVLGDGRSQIYLRLATAERYTTETQDEFERTASAAAGEPVTVILEQLLTDLAAVESLAELPPGVRDGLGPAGLPQSPEGSAEALRAAMRAAAAALPLPEGLILAGTEQIVREEGSLVTVGYLSETPLGAEARTMLETLLVGSLDLDRVTVSVEHVPGAPQPLSGPDGAAEAFRQAGGWLDRYPRLGAELLVQEGTGIDTMEALRAQLIEAVGDSARVFLEDDRTEPGIQLRLRVVGGAVP